MSNKYLSNVMREPEHYRRVIRLQTTGLVVCAVTMMLMAVALTVLLLSREERFHYFTVNNSGQLTEIAASDNPAMNASERAAWAIREVMEGMTFSFSNWEREIPYAKDGFADRSWVEFFDLMERMGWWGRIKNERVNLTTFATSAPFLVEESILETGERFVYEVALLHQWEGANGARSAQRTIAEVTIEQVEYHRHPSGFLITQINVQGIVN